MDEENTRLGAKFLSVGEPVPLRDRDHIAIGFGYNLSPHHVANIDAEIATNMRHVLEPGQTAIYTGARIGHSASVDWGADDAYTRAVDAATARVGERVVADSELQELMEKSKWSHEDRILWERRLSALVSEEVDRIPGLDEYRSSVMGRYRSVVPEHSDDPLARYPFVPYQDRLPGNVERDPLEAAYRRTYSLNALAHDIESGTAEDEYDCDIMSVTEGAVLQRVEDAMLPAQAEITGSYKYASPYFLATGTVTFLHYGADSQYSSYHAYLVSSATGGAIESTYDPSIEHLRDPYVRPQEGYDFDDFVRGEPLIDPDKALYDSRMYNYAAPLNHDYVATTLMTAMESQIGTLEELAARHEGMPEMQAAVELIKIAEQNGLVFDPDRAEQWKDLIQNSTMAPEFAVMAELAHDIRSYADYLRFVALADANSDSVPDVSVENRREIMDFLETQADRIARNLGYTPAIGLMFDQRPDVVMTAADVSAETLRQAAYQISLTLPPEESAPSLPNFSQSSRIKIEF